MKTITATILTVAATFSLASAAPAVQARDYGYGTISVKFLGATDNNQQSYSVTVPICEDESSDGTYTASYDPKKLSISYVEYDHKVAKCYFTGVNSANYAAPVETVINEYKGQLGPPQTITEVVCVKAY